MVEDISSVVMFIYVTDSIPTTVLYAKTYRLGWKCQLILHVFMIAAERNKGTKCKLSPLIANLMNDPDCRIASTLSMKD